MKQNTPVIYLQISTAQGPAECRIFARFVLDKLLAQAQAKGIDAELVTETADKHGIFVGDAQVGRAESRKPSANLAGDAPMGMPQPCPLETSAQKLVYRRFPLARYAADV